jgi:hypothetical protein
MEGAALSLPSWPQGMTELTTAQVAVIQSAQAAAQAAAQATLPNPTAFVAAAKTAFGGAAGMLAFPASIQNAILICADAINLGNWADVQAIISSFSSALNAQNAAIYPAIKAAAISNNIPVTLP